METHFSTLLNSVSDIRIYLTLNIIYWTHYEPVIFRRYDIAAGLKATKCGRACDVDGLAAEHCLHAFVPIIKNKAGDSSNINNYRPIALVTAVSKIFELCIINIPV